MVEILSMVRADPALALWLDRLPDEGPPVPLPAADALPEALLDLAIPHSAINEIVAVHLATMHDEGLTRLRERCAWDVLSTLGDPGDDQPEMPDLPSTLGAVGRLFSLYVCLAVVPHTRGWHRSRGIPDEITRRTFADLGRQVTKHQRRYGTVGMTHPWWPVSHLRGELFQLGRLQFQRARLGGSTGRAITAAGGPAGPGDLSLELHIPDFSGPLTPTACDQSIATAHEFFARHFPEETFTVAACHSWLLDQQLADRLPAHSNIVAFQQRFHPGYHVTQPSDALEFVFDDPGAPLDTQPRDTSLRRTVADHLRAGGHWFDANGWFAW